MSLKTLLLATALLLGLHLPSSPSQAQEGQTARVAITGGYILQPIGSLPNTVGYLTLTSRNGAGDRLLTVKMEISKKAELHSHSMSNGVMKMRPIEGGIEVPAGGSHDLKPGGDHIMIMGLTSQISVGDLIEVVLNFEQSGEVKISLPVKAR